MSWEMPVPERTVDEVWDKNGIRWNRCVGAGSPGETLPGGWWEPDDLEEAARTYRGYGHQAGVRWSWSNLLGTFGPLTDIQPPTPMEVIRQKVIDWAEELDTGATHLNDHALVVAKAMRAWLEESETAR